MFVASITELKPMLFAEAFPNVSFPQGGPSDEFLAEQGYAKVNVFREHDRATQKLVSVSPYYEAPWVYTVAVENLTQEELDARDRAQADAVRAERNARLAATDWVVIKAMETGTPIPPDVVAERQFLRDIPLQPGFPWDIQWAPASE